MSFRSTLISLILVFFWLLLPYFGVILYIPVPFLFIPSHSGVIQLYPRVIPPCSSIFRFIPVHSVPFHSVPVFSDAQFILLRYKSCNILHCPLILFPVNCMEKWADVCDACYFLYVDFCSLISLQFVGKNPTSSLFNTKV